MFDFCPLLKSKNNTSLWICSSLFSLFFSFAPSNQARHERSTYACRVTVKPVRVKQDEHWAERICVNLMTNWTKLFASRIFCDRVICELVSGLVPNALSKASAKWLNYIFMITMPSLTVEMSKVLALRTKVFSLMFRLSFTVIQHWELKAFYLIFVLKSKDWKWDIKYFSL